jgi:hypothetical protein
MILPPALAPYVGEKIAFTFSYIASTPLPVSVHLLFSVTLILLRILLNAASPVSHIAHCIAHPERRLVIPGSPIFSVLLDFVAERFQYARLWLHASALKR